MGRILIFAGIILSAVGFCGLMSQAVGGALDIAKDASDTSDAADYCNEGETLDTVQGASEYSPSTGYGRPTYFYCVDAEGNRREVTEQVVTGDVLNPLEKLLGSAAAFGVLIVVGIILSIVGMFVAIGRMASRASNLATPVGTPFGGSSSPIVGQPGLGGQPGGAQVYTTTAQSGQAVNLSSLIEQAKAMKAAQQGTTQQGAQGGETSLTDRLKQLDTAYQSGLITKAEYDKVRQQLLDSM